MPIQGLTSSKWTCLFFSGHKTTRLHYERQHEHEDTHLQSMELSLLTQYNRDYLPSMMSRLAFVEFIEGSRHCRQRLVKMEGSERLYNPIGRFTVSSENQSFDGRKLIRRGSEH